MCVPLVNPVCTACSSKVIINPRRACAARVRLSVSVLLPPRVTKWPRSDTNGFSYTGLIFKMAIFQKRLCSGDIARKQAKSQHANEYILAIATTFSTVFRRQRLVRVF